MEDSFERNEIYSKAVRAGKRTYFFDVKSTRGDDYYLTITESKRRFQNDDGKFSYEKHKLFLYKEDFEKFMEGLSDAISYIRNEQHVEERIPRSYDDDADTFFDDLGGEEPAPHRD
ncbi:MAG TPA: DUF3276 family protein [Bacteroidales bacterium]|nr:DUF3276 family protein [Bacteroidales bacterium]HRZ49324.1 DUF3276 family protein [Bacteroidales bacterium]